MPGVTQSCVVSRRSSIPSGDGTEDRPDRRGRRARPDLVSGVTRYRFRATLVRHWADHLVLALLIALLGGVAMGAVVAARVTQSSYPQFLRHTDASDLTLSTYGISSASATNYSPRTTAAIARLPEVKRVESWVGVFAVPMRDGAPELSLGNDLNLAASESGLYFHMDRATAVEGRVADPRRVDEFMTTALGAQLLGIHVGQVIPVGLYLPEQATEPGFGTARVPPARVFAMKLVGIVVFNNQVVEDDTDRLPTNLVYTPALARLAPREATQGTWYGIQLAPGARIAQVEQALLRVLPPGAVGNFNVTAITEAKVERAVKPESIALGVFGLIAALATLGTALPVLSRRLRATQGDREVLRALGAGPGVTLLDGLAGSLAAVGVGSVLACLVAFGLSQLAPLGPVGAVYHPGIVADWTVLGLGLVVLAGGLGLAALVIGIRTAPQRVARLGMGAPGSSRVAQSAAALGLPLPGVVGLHLALEPGRGRTAVPARSVLAGAVVAVTTVTATLTFGSSLHRLVTHPALYGWNWSYALEGENGVPPGSLSLLSHQHAVAAWSGYSDPNLQIDGQTVPALTTKGQPGVAPPILSGHAVTGAGQVVVGTATLASLHKHLGDVVTISYGSPNTAPLYLPPTPAVVVGTATFPAIAGSSTFAEHTGMGTGALVPTGDLPKRFLDLVQPPDPTLDGPALVFVRLRPGVSPAAGLAVLRHVVGVADREFAADPQGAGDTVMVLPVQRPAEIVNYQSTGSAPVVLAGGLGLGAALALALALVGTVRRRRPDLALLKTLGFTGPQLASALAWQASVTAVVGVIVGVPLGIVAGRQLWILFARDIAAVPQPAVPLSLVLVALGAVILANLVAAAPARLAAATPVVDVLHQE
ncbi:MAG TPA: FtsX-like permease family protein [Acidimicrobiales bacterium]|nr:FtsX-like permease family protein [Acidimicrobiales bacterium]